MIPCFLDHLAITAPTLALGAEYVRTTLGALPEPGGEHGRMGTHNLLLRLGETSYLEVIAANPAAPPPGRPRWFGLDRLRPDAPPALAAWVARTSDIRATFAACGEDLGDIEPMSRGVLDWLITIPRDGMPPLAGVAPALIEWHADAHPASRLRDRGLALARLELVHPEPERIARLLRALDVRGPVHLAPDPGPPRLVAHFDTPRGPRRLP